jgi:hypothetical protein
MPQGGTPWGMGHVMPPSRQEPGEGHGDLTLVRDRGALLTGSTIRSLAGRARLPPSAREKRLQRRKLLTSLRDSGVIF